MDDLANIRQYYAEEMRAVSNIQSAALVTAFAKVRREHFLGRGPWQIWHADHVSGNGTYSLTIDDNPKHLYHNIVVAIDASRSLNNGQPSGLAVWIDSLDLRESEHVVHIGCGVGYYTAIIAEVVGPSGHVTALEVDPEISSRARRNLEYLPNVEVLNCSGAEYTPEPSDAIFVNAGATHPRAAWLDRLRPGGRLLLPLTFASEPTAIGTGFMLKIKNEAEGYSARPTSPVSIYSCAGVRDAEFNQRLRDLLMRNTWRTIQSVRKEPHEPTDGCLLHGSELCISALPPLRTPSTQEK